MTVDTVNQFLGLGYPDWGDLLVAVSLIGAAYAWVKERNKERTLRNEELKWRRTEFIFEQAGLFDGDNEISEAVQIITANNVNVSVEKLLDLKSDMDPGERGKGRHKLDKLLNLMERLAIASKKGILTVDELSHFEWYFIRVKEITSLNKYCSDYYPAILGAATNLGENSS